MTQPVVPFAQLAPGFSLGRYRLLEPIGAGGMGEVWKAHDDNLDRGDGRRGRSAEDAA